MKIKILLGVSLLSFNMLFAQSVTQKKAVAKDQGKQSQKETVISSKNQGEDKLESTDVTKNSMQRSTSGSYLYLGVGGGFNQLKYDLSNGIQESILGYSGNLHYSYFFNNSIGLQSGIGIKTFGSLVAMSGADSTSMKDGFDNDYKFITTTKQYEEKQTSLMLEIPLMFQYRQSLNENTGLLLSVGGVFGYPFKSSYATTGRGELSTSGYWPNENATVTDLPQHGFIPSHTAKYQGDLALKPSYMGVAELGGLFKMSDNSDFYVGAYLNYGLNNIITPDTKPLISSDNTHLTYNGVIATSNVKKAAPFAFGLKLGIYLNIGNKDTDKDGVPDKKDNCPDTPVEAFGTIDMFGCPTDTDGDSIPDYLDACPDTPKEAYGKIDTLGCPLDTDKDSVPDFKDKCPDTPKEAFGKVDSLGCPYDKDMDGVLDYKDKCLNTPKEAIGKVDSLGCPLDTDADGVADYLDKCDDTPKAAKGKVDKTGCPLDTDKDGVLDYLDNCPKVYGTRTNKGCPEVKPEIKALFKKALQGIQFEVGKSTIKKTSFKLLNQIAALLIKNPTYITEVQGHTDNVGDDYRNQILSEERAEAVKFFLIDAGVDRTKISSKGYGETVPVASNATSKGKAKNRRVEFVVTFEEIIK